nr:uncharacterized protein LOC117685530 [Crassostrea gigas]
MLRQNRKVKSCHRTTTQVNLRRIPTKVESCRRAPTKTEAEKHNVPITSGKRRHTIVISDDSDGSECQISACGIPIPCTSTSETIPSEHGAGTTSSFICLDDEAIIPVGEPGILIGKGVKDITKFLPLLMVHVWCVLIMISMQVALFHP